MTPVEEPVDLHSAAAEQAHDIAVARKDILRIATCSRRMYCQMSSSVQFDSGNTRMLSPLALRALYSRQSSGRWLFGSQR